MIRFFLPIALLLQVGCSKLKKDSSTHYVYHDIQISENSNLEPLVVIFKGENLEIGTEVGYVNYRGDTIIPIGQYSYLGTDTLVYFAYVMLESTKDTSPRKIAIDRNGRVLFDMLEYDNGPDYFMEGLTRIKRNGKLGYANERGEVVIACKYAFGYGFVEGKAKVTFDAQFIADVDRHTMVDSDAWFFIDKSGNTISNY